MKGGYKLWGAPVAGLIRHISQSVHQMQACGIDALGYQLLAVAFAKELEENRLLTVYMHGYPQVVMWGDHHISSYQIRHSTHGIEELLD